MWIQALFFEEGSVSLSTLADRSFDCSMDRALSRILSLPLFDDEFSKALTALKLDRVEKFIVLEVKSGAAFLEKIAFLFQKSSPDSVHSLVERPNACSALIEILDRSASLFLNSAVGELGFAQSQSAVRGRGTVGLTRAVQSLAQESVLDMVVHAPKKLKTASSGAQIQLREKEISLNTKWSRRLQEIGDRAGRFAKINIQEGEHVHLLTDVERDMIKKMVLSMGSFRTLQVHVRHWERWEEWAKEEDLCLFPVTLDLMVKYALFLEAKLCGPTVIPSFLTAVNFVAYRLAIEIPDTRDIQLKALVDKVVQERGKEVKEATPFPNSVVIALEFAMVKWLKDFTALGIFTWWVLVMIFGSLRFDDACHVDPSTLFFSNEALYGVVWQTKTERKRRGTKFAVPRVSLSGHSWLELGWEEFKKILPAQRDFFIPELDDVDSFSTVPPTYARSLFWLKYAIVRALEEAVHASKLSPQVATVYLAYHKIVSWHSCRVTMLSMAVHEGESEQAIGLQANWKDPGPMVLKYARNRKQVALKMMSRLIGKMREDWLPEVQDAEIDEDVEAQSPDPIEFFLKDSKRSRGVFDLKFHVKESGFDATKTACKKLAVSSLISVGSVCPDLKQLCEGCRKNRPDLLLEA